VESPPFDAQRASFYRKFNLAGITSPAAASQPPGIELNGRDLTPEQVVQVVRHGAQVTISDEAMERVRRGFEIVLEMAKQGRPVYGLTTGVGQNKDKKVLGGSSKVKEKKPKTEAEKMEALLEQSRKFNLTSIRAHTSGTGDPMNRDIVRAGMLVRLNSLLNGTGGVQPAVVECLRDFLNHDITPLMPDCGSIGEGDLLLMGHVGLCMVGEWWTVPSDQSGPPSSREELENAGLDPDSRTCPKRIVHAREALAEAGINPVELVGKDFLSIISNNALTAGSAALGVHDTTQFLLRETAVFALCLQGINGNVAQFLEAVTDQTRPFPHMTAMAKAVREAILGSSLWDTETPFGRERAMQGPISYRVMSYSLGEVVRGLEDLTSALDIQMNRSDDNPVVVLDYKRPHGRAYTQQDAKYVSQMPDGREVAIIPTGNFESYPFVAPMEQILRGLGDLSTAMASTVLRFESPEITHLPRFLAASDGHGFGAVSKGVVALNDKINAITRPGQSTNLAVAGGQLEDIGTAGPVNVSKLHEVLPHLFRMASYQLMYASQAVDLHLRNKDLKLSPATRDLYDRYRAQVPPMNDDTQTTTALAKGARLLKHWVPPA
jgi:histidine ammonia-lyase